MRKHRFFSNCFVLVWCAFLIMPMLPAAAAAETAQATTAQLSLDGAPLTSAAYIINGHHYFRLRDLASLLKETDKAFHVQWDDETKTVLLFSNTAYGETDADGAGHAPSIAMAEPSACNIILDGYDMDCSAYLIDGSHYFKLRDILSAFNFSVRWSSATSTIEISTDDNYSSLPANASSSDIMSVEALVASNAHLVVILYAYDKEGEIVAQGSGYLIAPNGWILTCYHIFDECQREDAVEMVAVTEEGHTYYIQDLLAYDQGNDMALARAGGMQNNNYITLGDSDTLQRGQSLVVIGSPHGILNTISTGIVSGFRTDVGLRTEGLVDIQTTAPISTGSSGCPVFNLYGDVVGTIYATRVVGQNINYFAPINDWKPLIASPTPIAFPDFIEEAQAAAAAQEEDAA